MPPRPADSAPPRIAWGDANGLAKNAHGRVCVDKRGKTPKLVVTILGKENRVVASLGDDAPDDLRNAPREGSIPGKFIHPHAAIWTDKRDIRVCEWVPIGRFALLRKVC